MPISIGGGYSAALWVQDTGEGYLDPYEAFQVMESTTSSRLINNRVPGRQGTSQTSDSMEDVTPAMDLVTQQSSLFDSAGVNPRAESMGIHSTTDDIDSFNMTGCSTTDMEIPLEELRWGSLLELCDTLDSSFNMPALADSGETNASPADRSWQYTEGFQLQQVDTVEAKCDELRSYLRSSPANLPDGFIENYIARDQLVRCIELYGKHYQPIMPILHMPTFNLTTTQPVLLLAMMLVGACYSENDIPEAAIVQCAIHVLILIEDLPVRARQVLNCINIC